MTDPLVTSPLHSSAPAGPRTDGGSKPRARWSDWLMLILFTFISFESVMLAAVLKGPWFILLAPGAVCGLKAYDTWRIVREPGEE